MPRRLTRQKSSVSVLPKQAITAYNKVIKVVSLIMERITANLRRSITALALTGLTASLGFVASTAEAAPYTFLEGYNVTDEANLPGVGTNLAATAGQERGFGVDVENGIIYLARGSITTQDGRTNTAIGPFAVISVTNGFGGSNFKDTGLLGEKTNNPALFFSNGEILPNYISNRFLFQAQGTNPVDFLSVIYSAPRGTLGGAPAGGDPSALNRALSAELYIPNDLTNANGNTREGIPRGIASRTINGVTYVFLALGNHAEGWSNDAMIGSPQYPWRRLWGTLRGPIQDSVGARLGAGDTRLNGIEVDDEGNCYFSVEFTEPPRIWRVPANAATLAANPLSLDFDDRAIGGVNSNANSVITPVIPRLPSPAMMLDGTNTFYGPQDLTFFRTDGRKGLFVSSVAVLPLARTQIRAVARLVLDEPSTDANGYPFTGAAVVDAFGSSASPAYQDTILQSLRLRSSSPTNGLTQPMGGTTDLLYTQLNSTTNPTVIYFQAYVTDTNKGQTIPTAAIAKAAIPPLTRPPSLVSVQPVSDYTFGGGLISLVGSNFVAGATVKFDTTPATTVNFSNSTLLTAIAPAHSAGTVTVTVLNPDGQFSSLSNSFSYVNAPAPGIATVTPASGSDAGGTLVTITGSNFFNGLTVTFGSSNALSVNYSNATLITAVSPAHGAGTVNVSVQNPDAQTATALNAFTYQFVPPTPIITEISPSSGSVDGNTPVVIVGSNFAPGLTVKFGGSNATSLTYFNSSYITLVTPAHSAGPVDVTLVNPDLQSVTVSNGYTFTPNLPPPAFPYIFITLLSQDSVAVHWGAESNVVYAVEWRSNMFATNWTALGTVTGASSNASFTNNGLTGVVERYYRVVQLP